jgi:hypothetical protein
MLFSKKNKLEFVNSVRGVATLMPIIPACELKRDWVKAMANDYATTRKDQSWNTQRNVHIAKCPGIYSILRHGFILRAWQDITITTNGDGDSFKWASATNLMPNAVDFHDSEAFSKYFKNWDDHTLRTLIKMNTGWWVKVPNGYYLLEIPVAYSNENRFTPCTGYLTSETGVAHLSPSLLWHVSNGTTLITAGTALAQYVLVPKVQAEMFCRDMKDDDEYHLSELYDSTRFVKNYAEAKKFFKKLRGS